MAYIPQFSNDIFLSYAHDNNRDDWVTNLRTALSQALQERLRGLTIWWDKDQLRGNTEFDREIQDKIKSSAVLVAINSENYRDSDYCMKELNWFHEAAGQFGLSLSVNNQRRMFNVHKFQYDHKKWPERLKNINGNPFYDKTGDPLDPTSPEFKNVVTNLAREIRLLLVAIKEQLEESTLLAPIYEQPSPALPPSPTNTGSLPLSPGSGSLPGALTILLCRSSTVLKKPVCDKLLAALQPMMNGSARPGEAIRVVKDAPPPQTPLPQAEHDQLVIAEIKRADLVINLLNNDPGLPMLGQEEKTYIQRQVELGREHARRQLIWIQPDFDIASDDLDPAYSDFLQRLESHERSSVLRIRPIELLHEVTGQIAEIRQVRAKAQHAAAALLNYHGLDEEAAGHLKEFFKQCGVVPIAGLELDDPTLTMKYLAAQINQVSRLVCIYSQQVGRDWVSFRLSELLKMAPREPQACGIYFVPPLTKAQHGNFRLPTRVPLIEFDNTDFANPENLRGLV